MVEEMGKNSQDDVKKEKQGWEHRRRKRPESALLGDR